MLGCKGIFDPACAMVSCALQDKKGFTREKVNDMVTFFDALSFSSFFLLLSLLTSYLACNMQCLLIQSLGYEFVTYTVTSV